MLLLLLIMLMMILLMILSPSPDPPCRRQSERQACVKGLKMRPMRSLYTRIRNETQSRLVDLMMEKLAYRHYAITKLTLECHIPYR